MIAKDLFDKHDNWPSHVSEADGNYIAGLIAGEGSFILHMKTDSRSKRGGLYCQALFVQLADSLAKARRVGLEIHHG